MNKDIVIFGDNKKICLELKSILHKKHLRIDQPVIAGRHLESEILKLVESAKGKQIILVFKNEDLKNITEIFSKNGIKDICVCPWDTHYIGKDNIVSDSCILPIDNSKPRLNHVEIELSESCNLNCKGCFQYSNLTEGKSFPDIHVFRNNLEKLKEFFWGIGKIRLQGGEPLLNPDFLIFVKTAREIFPDSDLRLVSNGLLIPALNKSQLSVIKQNNCTFDISNYPPTQEKIKSIKKHLDEAGVSYTVSLPINIFFKSLRSKPVQSPDISFNNCIFTHCHALANGHLAACSHQFYVNRLNTAFDLKYPAEEPDEVVDIYHTPLNGWEINEIFDKPRDFCRYCSAGMVPFKWEPCPKNKAKSNDWIVKHTLFNTKIIPIMQKSSKNFINKLRHFKQKPKRTRLKKHFGKR